MTVQVNELGIRMRVGERSQEAEERQPKIPQGDCQDINREELVDDCVRRVLQILKSLEGR